MEEALRVGVRLTSAVATAHAAGILHRDIKPANVLTNQYGSPALADFGISGATDDSVIGHTTTTNRLLDDAGTGGSTVGLSVPWSPPEMFGDDPAPDVRSDIFSLAATIYTLLAGHTPFERPTGGNSQLDLAARIQRGAMTPLDRPDAPASLRAVLAKAMDPSAARRYATATDFARALQGVEIELGYHPTPLEVAGAAVDRPASAPDSVAEETRVRGITTVVAQQPVSPEVHSQPAPSPPVGRDAPREHSDPLDNTVVRVSGPTGPTEPTHARVPPPASDRGRLVRLGAIVGAAAVLIAGVIVVLNLPRGSAEPGDGGGVQQPSDESPVLNPLPSPVVFDGAVVDGAGVATFTWSNPDGEPDDGFVWRTIVNGQEGQAVPTDEMVAEVEQGAGVCIAIRVNRSGKLSDPVTGCAP